MFDHKAEAFLRITETSTAFLFCVKHKLVEYASLPVIDYGDVLHMNASAHCLHMLDSMNYWVLWFITNCGSSTHHCVLLPTLTRSDNYTALLH